MKKSSQKHVLWMVPVSLILSFLVLYDRSASILRQLYIQMRYGFSFSVVLISVVIFLILCIKRDHLKDLLLFTAILLFFSMSLAGVWAGGKSEPTMISGLIPIVDGENYYTDALRWLNGGFFSPYSAKRPIFAAFLAVLAKVSGQSIQIIQTLLMLIIAVTCFFAVREISKKVNPFGAALFSTPHFLFCKTVHWMFPY